MASAQVAAAGPATSTSHPYTCNTCQVAYRNIDLQKTHMKSDWHRYNLKRRVASLPPITAEIFTEKVLHARAVTSAEADKAFFEKTCEPCNKTYYSENAFRNHLFSQKHKQNEANPAKRQDDETTSVISSTFSLGDPVPVPSESVDSDAEDEFFQVVEGLQKAKLGGNDQQRPSPVKRPSNPHPVPPGGEERESDSATPVPSSSAPVWTLQSCVFCNYESPTTDLNVHHMERFHGMFIPEKNYLVDLEGLIKYLQRVIGKYYQCLSCGKVKSNLFAVQTHMKDKGHCKIPYTTEEDQVAIGDHYDFRSTYSDGGEDLDSESGEEEAGGGGAKLGAARAAASTKITDEDGEELDDEGEGEGWETDSSASSLDSADLTAVPAEGHIHQFERLSKHPHHSHHDPRHHRQADGYHSRAHKHAHAAFYDDYELHLPSGKAVGHRSLNKYYRQNLTHYPTAEEREERLAIEGAKEDGEGEGEARGRGRGQGGSSREIVPRGAAGMVGVTDEKRRLATRAEERGRKNEQHAQKKTDWAYSKKLNNQKTYYYRYDGGG